MKKSKLLVLFAAGGLALSACSSGTSNTASETSFDVADPNATGEITVWLMKGSVADSVVQTVNKKFKEAYPNVTVNVELQQWGGIQDKLSTSLNTDAPPDLVEIGSTFTAKYGDSGLLTDVTSQEAELGVPGMLESLSSSGVLDGARYGVPMYGGVRVVVYNKDQFKAANVTAVPTSQEEFAAAAEKLQSANKSVKGYSAFYFPGKYWYGALPFIWDNGGDIATSDDGSTWTGKLDSAESQAGLTQLNGLVEKYSTAPKDGDEIKNQAAFKTGKVGMMIDSWWAPGYIDSDPKWTGKVGAFPLPSNTAGETAPAFLGGSDLAVAQKSPNQALAYQWMKIMTSPDIQTQLAKEGGVIPNNEASFSGHEGDEFLQVADEAAKNSRFTPVSQNWGNVEASQAIPDMLVKIFTDNQTVAEASAAANTTVTDKLNGAQ